MIADEPLRLKCGFIECGAYIPDRADVDSLYPANPAYRGRQTGGQSEAQVRSVAWNLPLARSSQIDRFPAPGCMRMEVNFTNIQM